MWMALDGENRCFDATQEILTKARRSLFIPSLGVGHVG
jgi:hypothetical protein